MSLQMVFSLRCTMTLNFRTNILLLLLAPLWLFGQALPTLDKSSEVDSMLLYTYELGELQPARAIEISRKLQRLAIEKNDSLFWADALKIEGGALLNLHDFQAGGNALTTALSIYQQNRDTAGMAGSLWHLARLDYSLGHQYQALAKIKKGLRLATASNAVDVEIKLLSLRARVESDQQELKNALATAMEALHLSKEHQYKILRGELYNLLADISLKNNQPAKARAYLENALVLHESFGNFDALSKAHAIYAQVWHTGGNNAKALEEIQLALALARQHAFPYTYTEQLLQYSAILLDENDTLRSLQAARLADSVAQMAPVVKPLRRDIALQLSRAYLLAGDSSRALTNLLLYQSIDDSIQAYGVKELLLKGDVEEQKVENQQLNQEKESQEDLIDRSKMLLLLAGGLITVFILLIAALVGNVQRKRKYSKHLIKKSQAIQEKHQRTEEEQVELKAQNERLSTLDKNKNKIFSVLTHDIRQPINQIRSVLNLLEMEGMSEEERLTIVEKLKESVDNSSNALENLLLWSKKQMTGISTRIVDVHLLPQVWQLESQVQPNLDSKELTLEIKVPEFFKVKADMSQLDICLRNLVNNAIKFSDRESKITIEATEAGDNQLIKVIDRGMGMAPEQLAKLREMTANFSTTGTMNEKGTGLGILITHEFMQGQNGSLQIKSEKGVGSTFTLAFPKENKDYSRKPEPQA